MLLGKNNNLNNNIYKNHNLMHQNNSPHLNQINNLNQDIQKHNQYNILNPMKDNTNNFQQSLNYNHIKGNIYNSSRHIPCETNDNFKQNFNNNISKNSK